MKVPKSARLGNSDAPIETYDSAKIKEYLRRLASYAADRLTRRSIKAMRARARRLTFSSGNKLVVVDLDEILRQPPERLRTQLREHSSPQADLVRALMPLHVCVPRNKREAIMRSVAGAIVARGVTMQKRWDTNNAPTGWIDWFIDHLLAALGDAREQFATFVSRTPAMQWLVSADFCIEDKGKHNDVFAFTIIPIDRDLNQTITDVRAAVPQDFKFVKKEPHDDALRYLASDERFSFAFLASRTRKLFSSRDGLRNSIDAYIETLQQRHDPEGAADELAAWKALRQSANANNFNMKIMTHMVLAAAFAGAIAMLLASEGRASFITFALDRDNMTTMADGALYKMIAANAWSFSFRRRYPPFDIGFCIPDDSTPQGAPWYDPLIRQPDFIAGVLAGINLSGQTNFTRYDRDRALLEAVIADNSNIVVINIPELRYDSISTTRLTFHKDPNSTPSDRAQREILDRDAVPPPGPGTARHVEQEQISRNSR